MVFESFTQGARQNKGEAIWPEEPAWLEEVGWTFFLLINVGAWVPDPMAPWHPAQPLRT
jgi:hypothetical protein